MPFERRPIPPNPPRWQPNPDPDSIEIPGLDTSAPPGEQIEQIEQLITLKLQNIDENFSKIHHILSTRILPAVKKYAVGTEPVREAAKFWVSFYEQAAQIRIPTYEEEEAEEPPSEHPTEHSDSAAEQSTTETESSSQPYDSESIISSSSESSFMPGQAAFSSTPATNRVVSANQTYGTDQSGDSSSWTTSLESPLIRLDRELKNFSKDDLEGLSHDVTKEASTFRQDSPSVEDTVQGKGKGKAKEQSEPLLRSVLRHTVLPAGNASSNHTPHLPVSPLRPKKLKTPVAKDLNPYLPPNSRPKDWSGVVDLRDPSITTPQHYKPYKPSSSRIPSKPAKVDDSDSDSSDDLPPGMSPPRFMSPARPKQSADLGKLKLGQTPRRDAIARITQDAISDIQSVASGRSLPSSSRTANASTYRYNDPHGGTESSMSTVLTPPSLSKYTRDTTGSSLDTSLEAMMHRVGLKGSPQGGDDNAWYRQQDASPSHQVHPEDAERSYDDQQQQQFMTPNAHQNLQLVDDDDDDDSFFDDTAHPGPSAAFLMASQNRRSLDGDDSFDRSDDSLDQDANIEGMAPVHPFARAISIDDNFDDSFDDDSYEADMRGAEMQPTEETLFGVPPGQREQQHAMRDLRMLGGNFNMDTSGLTEQINNVADTPTPAGGTRG
ncbi:DASH complex subunit ask1 [Marasmius sp. AFHP31]|nr:DASH complex subunit ask1 [Marasmius sp. AFHP31]